jgi:hypothetical protein
MARGWSLLLVSTLVAVARVAAALPIDYGREDRWAQEVVPSIVVGEPIYLATSERPRILAILTVPPGAPKGALVVVHGLGVHPDFGMINGVRTGLADAGYTTLSLQMPVLAAGASRDDYRETLRSRQSDRRCHRLSSPQRCDQDWNRLAQHGRVDGQCLSSAR